MSRPEDPGHVIQPAMLSPALRIQRIALPGGDRLAADEQKADRLSGVRSLECQHLRGNKFAPQPHQAKAIEIYNRLETGQRGILLYHKFGTGKTCTSILVADDLLKTSATLNHVWVLTPGNLRRNFHYEYCFVCGKYVADFKNNYTFVSYNYSSLQTSALPSFDNSVIIIDEIHNLIKTYINAERNQQSVAKALVNKLKVAHNVKIIALSGDPIYSRPKEIAVIFEILKPSLGTLNIEELLSRPEKFKQLIRGLVSYVSGNTEDFPQIVERIVECKMSPIQTENLIAIEETESRLRRFSLKYPLVQHRDFNNCVMAAKLYIRSRRASNFWYPPWAGLNIKREKEAGGTKLQAGEVEAELGGDGKEGESATLEAQEECGDKPVPKFVYFVVDKEGLGVFETYLDDAPLLSHLNRGGPIRRA